MISVGEHISLAICIFYKLVEGCVGYLMPSLSRLITDHGPAKEHGQMWI